MIMHHAMVTRTACISYITMKHGKNAHYLSSVIKKPAAEFVKYKYLAIVLIIVHSRALWKSRNL
jgi:hypothetical protein